MALDGDVSFRELTIPTLLGSSDSLTLSVVVWTLWNTGQVGQSSAVTLVMIAVALPFVLILLRLTSGGTGQRASAGMGRGADQAIVEDQQLQRMANSRSMPTSDSPASRA
jgi:hypothetical protein